MRADVEPVGGDAGTRLGRYRLLRTVASDAVSTTYFATTDGGRQRGRSTGVDHYAVRIGARVDPNDEEAVEMVRRFLSEEQRAGVVDHPTVVRPHDLGIIDGRPFVATPFIRAVPLGELLEHGGAINHPAALAMFAQLAAALDTAHRAGVVHGALSPRTIWVGPSIREGAAYVAYLTGFGTATLLRHHLETAPPGPPVQDVLYVAPEQLRGEPSTGHSDQYALACAVYHTLAGRPPFERETRSKLYGAHLLAPPPVLDARDSVGAPTTREALLRAMSKTPDERFATCGALIHEALPVDPPRRERFGGTGRGRRGQAHTTVPAAGRRSWWPFAVAALAVVAMGAAVWWVARPGDELRSPGSDRQTAARVDTPPITEPRMTAASTARRIAWDVSVSTQAVAQIEVVDGTVVVRDDGGRVMATDPADGTVRWRQNVGATGAVAVDGDLVVHGGEVLGALGVADGSRRWTAEDVGPVLGLAASDRMVVAAAGERAVPRLTALGRADGAPVWSADLSSAAGGEAAGEGEPVLAAGADVAYALQGDGLVAFDGSGRRAWGTTAAAWPVLAAVGNGVLVATEDGQVCRYAAADGAVRWCDAVPGVESQAPRLFAEDGPVIVATPEAVVALDARSGGQEWSASPGSPTNQVVVGSSRIVIADGAGLRVLEADTGEMSLELPELGNITALTASGERLYVGSAEGGLMALELTARG